MGANSQFTKVICGWMVPPQRHESFGDRDDFENNTALTAIDRRIIVSARPVVAKSTAAYETAAGIVGYPSYLLTQVKVRSLVLVQYFSLQPGLGI